MSAPINVTHRKGEACPADIFIATPPEAYRGAHFMQDVEVTGTGPYRIRYSGALGSAVFVDIDPAFVGVKCDGRGNFFENVDIPPGGFGSAYQVGEMPSSPVITDHTLRA